MAAAGALDRGLAMVDLCWGPELDMGGTTFWEISSPDWAAFTAYGDAVPNGENGYTSLCHPWSAGPSAWLAAHALGVSRELPGSPWGDVRVAPHVSPAMRAEGGPLLLRGEVPLGLGVAGVEVGAGGEVAVALPPGTSATLLLSEALLRAVCGGACPGGLPASVVLLGRDGPRGDPRWARSEALRWARRGAAALPADYAPPLLEAADGSVVRGAAAALRLEGAAHFTVKLFQEGAAATPPPPPPAHRAGAPFPPPTWRAPFLGADRLTRGDWVGVYGRDGGVLWGLGAAANGDKAFLPPWVASVTPRYAFLRGAWADGANVTDRRAPQNPNDPTGPRSVGYLTDSMGHDPTFAVDVALGASGAPPFFTVALYAVDWDSRGRRGTVALLDGATLDALSPIQGVSDYTEGVWLRWNVSGAFRLRVSQTRGDNAPITALLFN
jgi:alpha-L-rhamnosidase